MPTIVWTDEQVPQMHPDLIVSPRKSRLCCLTNMTPAGPEQTEQTAHAWRGWGWQRRVRWQLSRCAVCGFTVRRILADDLDAGLAVAIRKELNCAFVRDAA